MIGNCLKQNKTKDAVSNICTEGWAKLHKVQFRLQEVRFSLKFFLTRSF